MAYSVTLTRPAERQLGKLPPDVQRRIITHIADLADDAHPPGCRVVVGVPSAFRIRIGDYRVIYAVSDEPPEVAVVAVGHRRDISRRR